MPSTAPNVGADTCASPRRAQRLQGPGWRRDLTSLSLPPPHTGAASRVHFVGLRPPLTPPHPRTPRIRPREPEESRKKGGLDAAREAAEVAVELFYPLATVCRVLEAPRSTVYHRRGRGQGPRLPGR